MLVRYLLKNEIDKFQNLVNFFYKKNHILATSKKIVNFYYNFYDSKKLYLIGLFDKKKLIDNGMYVGCHGSQHIHLGKESKENQNLDIELSLQFLKKIGTPVKNWIMCYPCGSYNMDTLDTLKSKNCLIGLTTKVGYADLDRSKMLELSRFDTNDFPQ